MCVWGVFGGGSKCDFPLLAVSDYYIMTLDDKSEVKLTNDNPPPPTHTSTKPHVQMAGQSCVPASLVWANQLEK